MKVERVSLVCERCEKPCRARVPDLTTMVKRPFAAPQPRLVCLKCVDIIRKSQGGVPAKEWRAKAPITLPLFPGLGLVREPGEKAPKKPRKKRAA